MQFKQRNQPVRSVKFVVRNNVFDRQIFIVIQRRLETSDSARGFSGIEDSLHLPCRQPETLCHFREGRIAAQLSMQPVPLAEPASQGFPGMGRDTDGLGLLVNRSSNRLFYPVS